jgi:hypothetical protein
MVTGQEVNAMEKSGIVLDFFECTAEKSIFYL